MPDKIIPMKKTLKKTERIVLMRALLRDGMTQAQADQYLDEVEKEIKRSHEMEKKRLRRKKVKNFNKEFNKLIHKKGKGGSGDASGG